MKKRKIRNVFECKRPTVHTPWFWGPNYSPKETLGSPNCALWHCVKGNILALQNKEQKNRGNMNFDQTDDSLVRLVNFPGIFTSRFIFRRQTLLMFLFGGFDSTKK